MTVSRAVIRSLVVTGIVGAGLAAASLPPRIPADRVLLFEGARLITGDGGLPIERSAFVVRGGAFAAVGRQGEVKAPAGAIRVDLAGKTVIPALVDVHTHLGYRKGETFRAENFTRDTILDEVERLAYYGIAAAASAGTDRGDETLRLRVEPHPGALVRTAWRGLAPPDAGPNPPMRDAPFGVSTEDEARRDVRELAARKADFVKIWVDDRGGTVPKLSPLLYRAIIDEAHRTGLRVFAHIAALADAKDLLRAGVDGFLHAVRDRDVDDELVGLFNAHREVFVTPTLFAARLATYDSRPAWLDEPAIREAVPAAEIDRIAGSIASRRGQPIEAVREEWNRLARNVAKLHAAGVTIALGTDVGGASAGGMFGWTEHVELEDLVAAGLTPGDAIVAATRAAARILRLDRLGTIASGQSADFLVLNGNPLEHIAYTRRIARVYIRGDEVRRN